MASDADRYLLAAFLPDEERLALEREAEGDAVARDLIRTSHELRAYIDGAEALRRDAGSEQALAFLAASSLAPGRTDPEWTSLLDRLERSIADRPGARETFERLTTRIRELESGSDAEAHFRRLSGSGPSRPHRLRPLLVAAAVIVAIAATGVLGRVMEDPVALSAHRSLLRTTHSTFRGPPTGNEDLLSRAAEGRTLVLGIWPTYDRELLEAVEWEMADPESGEDWLVLGQVRLMLGDHEGAAVALDMARAFGTGREAEGLLRLIGRVD